MLGYLAKGGTERQVAYLSSGLVQRGHQVRIYLLGQPLADDYPVAAGVQVLPLQITKWRHCLAGWRELRAAFRSSDVVYSFLDIANALCGLCRPKDGAPLVWGLRAANTSPGWLPQFGLWLSQRLSARAHGFIANSQAVRDYYQTQQIGGERISVIANGVQLHAQPPVNAGQPMQQEWRAELEIPNQGFVGLILARAASEKRQALGLKLLEQIPELYLVFAGDGVLQLPGQWQSQRLVTKSILERCRFLEHQSDVGRLLGSADVLLSLSSAEGLPNAVLEAMAHDLPVVATAVGGVVELLAGTGAGVDDFGWLVRSSQSEAELDELVRALVLVRAGGSAIQQRIHNARQRVVSEYGIERMINQTEDLLSQLINPA